MCKITSTYKLSLIILNEFSTASGRWSAQEHGLFLQGLMKYGKGWKKIAEMIQTRNVVQVRTHAQKYFQKLERSKQQQMMMNGENGCENATGGVVGLVSVSIAENSSLPSIASVMEASSNVEGRKHSQRKTGSKRKLKVSKGAAQDDNESSNSKTSNKKGRTIIGDKSPMIEFYRASQDETDEETKSETSNSDMAHPSIQLDMYNNNNSSQSEAPLKIKLEKTKKHGATGTPSPTSISEELPCTQATVVDDWLNLGTATLNFHSNFTCDPEFNNNKINMNMKQNRYVTGYAIPVPMESTLATSGFFEPTFDDNIITQDILDIFEV